MEQWISVKDKLPQRGQIVIVSDGIHTWDVGQYRGTLDSITKWWWKKHTIKDVLWWQPKEGALPDTPKEDLT